MSGGTESATFDFDILSDFGFVARRGLVADFVKGMDLIDLQDPDATIATSNQAFLLIGSPYFTGIARSCGCSAMPPTPSPLWKLTRTAIAPATSRSS